MRVRCSCGREVDVPDGQTSPAVCPDCGRSLNPADPPSASRNAAVPPPPPGTYRGKSRTPLRILLIAGLVLILMLVACAGLFVGLFLPMLKEKAADSDRAVCANNLRLIGQALLMYANENRGDFPPLPAQPGRLMFDPEAVYPEYVQNPEIFVCPADYTPPVQEKTEALISDSSYIYLSHALINDAEGTTFARIYRERMAAGLPMAGDIPVDGGEGSAGKPELMRLRIGVERLLAKDPLDPQEIDALTARIPVLVEWPTHHDIPGGNVFFLDGHVEFVRYPGPFPMTERFIGTLREMGKK